MAKADHSDNSFMKGFRLGPDSVRRFIMDGEPNWDAVQLIKFNSNPGQQRNLRSSWLEYGNFCTINTQAKPVILSRAELITTSRGDFLFWQNEMARKA